MRILCIVLFFTFGQLMAQNPSVNAYQYVIVPKTFDFQKRPNQYLINTVLSYELRQLGFETLYDDELPKELAQNPCRALKAKLSDQSSMFATKVVLDLMNCEGQVVISTGEGKSKIKDFEAGYREAIQKAVSSWDDLGYTYDASLQPGEVTTGVESSPEEVVNAETTQTETVMSPSVNSQSAVVSEVNTEQDAAAVKETAILYAQEINGGFQLVNTTPEVVFVITKTSKPDTFLLKNKEGMLYREGELWVAEYYEKGDLVKIYYQIRF